MNEQAFNRVVYRTTDPTTCLDGKPVPALTTLLHRVCDNDETKFEEALRLIELFVSHALNPPDLPKHPARPLDATYHESIPADMSAYWRSLVADYAAHLQAAYARERYMANPPRKRVRCERCGVELGYVIRTVRGNHCEQCHDIVWQDVPEMIWND